MRADALRNHQRIIAASRDLFATHVATRRRAARDRGGGACSTRSSTFRVLGRGVGDAVASRGRGWSPCCSRHQLVFVDRLVATLIHLRHDLPHSVLGLLFGVERSTVTRAIAEIRALLAEPGCAVPDRPGLRLRTKADVFAYAQTEGIELRLDATEIQVCRPPAGRGGRRAFVSGKKRQNTMKATVIADWRGRTFGPAPCGLVVRTMPRPPATRASPSASSTSPTSRSSRTMATSA